MKEYCFCCGTDVVHNVSTTMDVGFIPGIAFFILIAMFHQFIDFPFMKEYCIICGTDVVHSVCTTMDVAFIWELHFSYYLRCGIRDVVHSVCTTMDVGFIREMHFSNYLQCGKYRRCTQRLYHNGRSIQFRVN